MALPIAEYAVIGDRRTAALVGTNGSIDWACLPRFDSPACFAALLGSEDHGHWQLVPEDDHSVSRRYLDDTTVLETTFTTSDGVLVLTDAMPSGDDRVDIVRTVRCAAGRVRVRHAWRIRLDYGEVRPWVQRRTVAGEPVISAIGGPDQLILRGSVLPKAQEQAHVDELDLTEGDELTFQMTWLPSHVAPDGLGDPATELATAVRAEQEWAELCPADVPHVDAVRRSLLTLRLMTHEVTGGIVAAPTTSLPEELGGVRNWDYRYTWLRDAALTLTALVQVGHTDEAGLWRNWLLRTIAGAPAELQIMYGVGGERRLAEQELGHLPGYAGSRPVRIGNGAFQQRQLDVIGETLDALAMIRDSKLGPDDDAWALQLTLLEDLTQRWQDRDHGIWEIRGEPQHFTHSRVMVWVAFDRGVRAIEQHGLDGPLEHWRSLRDQVREEVLTRGFDTRRNTFTQHYETTEVDAALLVLPIVGFVAGDDPRMLGTLAAIENDLMRDGLPLRYRTETGVDGLAGDEHPFLACAFWLVSAYSLAGRTDDAHALFDRLVALTNDVGLLSEEYDARNDRMIGNFPQALSHLSLVQAALHLSGRYPPGR